jgi:TonB-dependent starch-binding outer membrane protein SusC
MKKNHDYYGSFRPYSNFSKFLLKMKITTLLLFCGTLSLLANKTYSQSTKISLDIKGASVEMVLDKIEQESEFYFLYNQKLIDVDRKVDIVADNKPISDILKNLFGGYDVKYAVYDRQIILTNTRESGFMDELQQFKVTGKVTDASTGLPLPGVNVVVSGTTIGAITDINGNYSIDLANPKGSLEFTFIGYARAIVPVQEREVINVQMNEEATALDEIVVVGYGTVKKSDVTGALTSIPEGTLKARPVQNTVDALQGKVAGVDITSNIRPGEISSISIRGTRSISGSNAPLYVIDGIVLMGNINDINPSDIAHIEILKDASATAIYGSRGANGVVLITTKTGKKGRLSINYDASLSFDNINSVTDWALAGEALDRYRLASINAGQYLSGSTARIYPDPAADIQIFGNSDAATISAIRQGYEWRDPGVFTSVKNRVTTADERTGGLPDSIPVYNPGNIPTTDWVDYLTRTAVTQNHLFSLSAGNDNSNLYISFGYLNNKGTQTNQGYNRYTLKLNGDITPQKWITVGSSLSASKTDQLYGTVNRAGSATGVNDAYGTALNQYVMAQPYDAAGNLIINPGGNTTTPVWNPLIDANLDNTRDERQATNLNVNLFTELRFTPWLSYRMNFGSGARYYGNGTFQSSQSTLLRTPTATYTPMSSASYSTGQSFQYMVENLLYFNKKFGAHTIGATLMQSAQYSRNESAAISASKILYNSSLWYNLGANLNGKPDSYSTSFGESSLESYMGRINYSFMDRYLITATGRWDGSSVLATGHKWDFFPSFAAAWKMQEEDFIKRFNWINELKLRVGYGVAGNSAVGSYTTMGPLTQYNYVFNTSPAIGMIPFSMANPNLKWEKTAQLNIGLDFSLIKERISGTIEYYISNTHDILMSRTIPVVTGYPSILFNIGKMKNSGVEITLSTVNLQISDFRWKTDLSFTSNKEEIVSLVNGKEDMPTASSGTASGGWFIGYPLQVFRGYKVDGLWQNTPEDLAEIALWKANGITYAPGQYKPVEQGTPDHLLNDADKVILGTPRPKWIGGITNTFTYKNFELSSFIYARIGQSYFSSLQPGGSGGGKYVGYVRSVDQSEFWSPANTGARWPQVNALVISGETVLNQAMYVNNGSFVTVRNISLAYTVPQSLLGRFSAKSFQVYGQVLNPFIFGSDVVKAGINPDDTNGWISSNSAGDPVGGSNNNTMMITSWVFGIRIGF